MPLREQELALPLPSIYSLLAKPCNTPPHPLPLRTLATSAGYSIYWHSYFRPCLFCHSCCIICVLTNNTSSFTTSMTSAAVWPFVLASVPVIPSLKRSSKVNIAESRSWKRNATRQLKLLHNQGRAINVIFARNMAKLIHCMKCTHRK